jgi:hypothetical protein
MDMTSASLETERRHPINPVINVLKEIAPIAHWTVWPGSDAGEELACPPVIAWSYERPTKKLQDFLRRAVTSFAGSLAWKFLVVEGSRWIVLPTRVVEYDRQHRCNGYLLAGAELKASDPEFGKRANSDLSLLAQHIRCRLKERKSA